MKYITVRLGLFRFPIIFPDSVTHRTVAANFNVVSAGFVSIDEAGEPVAVYGKSTSLGKLQPIEGDLELIQTFMLGEEAMLGMMQDIDADDVPSGERSKPEEANDDVLAALFSSMESPEKPVAQTDPVDDLASLNQLSP